MRRMMRMMMMIRMIKRRRVPKKTMRRIPHHGKPLVHLVLMKKSPGL